MADMFIQRCSIGGHAYTLTSNPTELGCYLITHFTRLIYRVFIEQADWTLTHMSHKDRTEHNRSFYNIRWRNTDALTDQVITE
jgi:hypothetical protein